MKQGQEQKTLNGIQIINLLDRKAERSKMYKNYVFDLYGTLVDIHTDERKQSLWNKIALIMSMQGADYEHENLNKRYEELIAEQQTQIDVEVLLEDVFKRLYLEKGVVPEKVQIKDIGITFRALSLEKLRLFDGAKELLERLRKHGKKVYLLSNAQRLFTEPEMRLLGIYEMFDGILYSSDIGFKKPSPLFYNELIRRYSLKKDVTVMIGNDSIADIGGAYKLGLDSMYVHTEQSPTVTEALPDNCRRLARIGEVY